MPAKLENSAVAIRPVFIPIPKEGNAKESSNYHTIALISHIIARYYSKSLELGFNST